MRRLTSFATAFAAAMSLSGSAMAASLFFESVTTAAVTGCAAPCFQVRAFLNPDALTIQAIQLHIDVQGASPADLPVPPATNPNAQAGNTNVEDGDGNIAVTPWNLSATVGKSPTTGFDALIVNASDTPFTVAAVDAVRDAGVGCTPAALCTTQREGLDRNQIYLGRFNITGGQAYSLAIGEVTGLEREGVPLPAAIAALQGGSCTASEGRCTVQVPEPVSVLLLGATLLGLGWVRRRS